MHTEDELERLRRIPLNQVLPLLGATPDPHDPQRWHTAEGTLSITGQKFFNWNQTAGGGGAIDLIIHLLHLDFKPAIAHLQTIAPGHDGSAPNTTRTKTIFTPPAPDPDFLPAVRNYLIAHRKLPPHLIDPLIQKKTLYADPCANAVFLMRTPARQTAGAELRGTDPARPWRGLAPASRKKEAYFSIRIAPQRPRAILLCESAIDAISCLSLHPQTACLSTAGIPPDPPWLPLLLACNIPTYCAYDADAPGEQAAQRMIQRYPEIQRLRPTRKDWNDQLRAQT